MPAWPPSRRRWCHGCVSVWVLLARLLGYLVLAIFLPLLMPTYHPRFRLGWRGLGLFFAAASIVVFVRIIWGVPASAVVSDYVLTTAEWVAIVAVFVNLFAISRKGLIR